MRIPMMAIVTSNSTRVNARRVFTVLPSYFNRTAIHSDGQDSSCRPHEQHDPSLPVVRTKMLADVDQARRNQRSRLQASDFHAAFVEPRDFLGSGQVVRPLPDVNDPSVVAAGSQPDRRQGSDDAAFCAAQSLKIQSMARCEIPRFLLVDEFSLAAASKLGNGLRNRRGDAQPRIAPGHKPVAHHRAKFFDERFDRTVNFRQQPDGGGAVVARARNTWIFQQLVPNDQPAAVLACDVPNHRTCQLVGARGIERVGVINADVDHSQVYLPRSKNGADPSYDADTATAPRRTGPRRKARGPTCS